MCVFVDEVQLPFKNVKNPYLVLTFVGAIERGSGESINNLRCKELTRGLGGGGKPDVGMNVAKESRHSIEEALNGSDMVGMGRGTGAGPIITGVAKSMGILIVDKLLTPLITTPGSVNVDFADVRAIVANAGSSLMGIRNGTGKTRARDAALNAIQSPLINQNNLSYIELRHMSVSITLIATGVKREQGSRLSHLKVDFFLRGHFRNYTIAILIW
ncbi:hypothetical protein LXL04_011676 [Taraxacum kok-saghyz]